MTDERTFHLHAAGAPVRLCVTSRYELEGCLVTHGLSTGAAEYLSTHAWTYARATYGLVRVLEDGVTARWDG